MARIKLYDLQKDAQISKEEMKKVFGGATDRETGKVASWDSLSASRLNDATLMYKLQDYSANSLVNPDDIAKPLYGIDPTRTL